jgi:hypothetical protein
MRHTRTALKYGGDITNDQLMELQPFEWANEKFIVSLAMIRTNIGCKLTKLSWHFWLKFSVSELNSMQGSNSYGFSNSDCLGARTSTVPLPKCFHSPIPKTSLSLAL